MTTCISHNASLPTLACCYPLTPFLLSHLQNPTEQAGSGTTASEEFCTLFPYKTGHVEQGMKLGHLFLFWLMTIGNGEYCI